MGSTKAKWRNGILTFYDGTSFETTRPIAPVYFYDDFNNTAIQTAAAGVVGWTAKDTGAANVPPAILANQTNGIVEMGLAADNEKMESGLYFGDALNFNLDKGPIFEIKAAVHTVPTGQSEIYFGLANAYVEGPIAEADAGPTIHAFFCFDGSAVAKIYTDDTVTDNNAVATGITVVADIFHIYQIDFTTITDVKFYIDGVAVGTGTTISMAQGADVVTQPFIMVHKETGVGLGYLYVDYVRIWSPR